MPLFLYIGVNQMKVMYITGYKPFEYGIFKNDHEGVTYIKKAIKQRLTPFVEEGLEWVIITGQLGTELWAAETVYELREEFGGRPQVGVITPYLNQEESWKEDNKEYYESVIGRADFVGSIYQKPYEGPHQLKMKNEYLVKKSDAMLLLYDEEREGSPKFALNEAKKQGEYRDYPVFQVSFDDLQQAGEEQNWAE